MKLNRVSKLIMSLILVVSISQASVLTELHGTKGQADKELNQMIEKLDSIGFTATAKNKHIEQHYYNIFKEKNLDLLNFYTIIDIKSLRELLIQNPDFGAYSPFNLLAFKKFDTDEGGDTTWYGHLDSETMLDIIGDKDVERRKKFTEMIEKVDKLVIDEMKPTATKKLTFKGELPAQPLLKMVKKFEDVDDIEEYVDEFIMQHDTLFGKNKFVIAGFIDLKFEYGDMDLDFEEYDAYWVSSLCHFEFSNAVFNHGSPHAGVFAPCSVYFYIPKGSNELHVGYGNVENWINSTGITDKKQIAYMQKIADDVRKTFEQLGFIMEGKTTQKSEAIDEKKIETKKSQAKKESSQESSSEESVVITIPTVSEAPKSIKVKTINGGEDFSDRTIQFSKRYPPGYIAPKDRVVTSISEEGKVGEVKKGRISVNLRGALIDVATAKEKLAKAGFEVIAVAPLNKKGTLISIVFTNDELKKIANKQNKGFVATLRVLIDEKKKQISVTNPLYVSKAFLQEDFNEELAKKLLSSITKEFPNLKDSLDKFKFQSLPKFQFMEGMPYYQDMEVVARGDNLLEKIKNNKMVIFELNLGKDRTVVGVELSKRTRKFPQKIGTKNAGMLPYSILIENGEAKILNPKYYISVMYPFLKMEEFMTIATVPDAIIKDCAKVFK
ncbi:hypothetical protein MNB_SV-12-514 [hydrothermal vent metagenome]|uniref:Uncharacterized protein n=1 Tax=hydrothermal vent metagenome TaxID=652676 RepID=A0A1W1CNF8_9ZZZZ